MVLSWLDEFFTDNLDLDIDRSKELLEIVIRGFVHKDFATLTILTRISKLLVK